MTTFLQHLRTVTEPLKLRRTPTAPVWVDQSAHAEEFRRDPELYALSGLAARVRPEQRARVLFHLLRESRAGLDDTTRRTLDRVAHRLLAALSDDAVLTVFLALRRQRANHKHTTRAILRHLLNHPRLEVLARRRRPALRDSLEHALGRDVVRACVKHLAANEAPDYVQRHLLRFADNRERAVPVLLGLYKLRELPEVADDAVVPALDVDLLEPQRERPRTVTVTNRGDIAATLVHLYRGGASSELQTALERYVADAAVRLPHFDGVVAVVLDTSTSTRGYGEREFACVSQSVAFRLVLEKCCRELRLFGPGGQGDLPQPEGATDLATGLLDALAGDPDVVAIVSDGYENALGGDLARVAATLPQCGVRTPVVFIHSKFTDKDDLTLRQPAPALPELSFWHEDDFEEVLWGLFTLARGDAARTLLREQMLRRLRLLEDAKT